MFKKKIKNSLRKKKKKFKIKIFLKEFLNSISIVKNFQFSVTNPTF